MLTELGGSNAALAQSEISCSSEISCTLTLILHNGADLMSMLREEPPDKWVISNFE